METVYADNAEVLAHSVQTQRPTQEARQASLQSDILDEMLDDSTIDRDTLDLVPERLARKYVCLPIRREDDGPSRRSTLVLAMANPFDLIAMQDLQFSTGCAIKPVHSSRQKIEDAIERHYAPDNWIDQFLSNIKDTTDVRILAPETKRASDPDPTSSSILETPAVKLASHIIQQAVKAGASDIHIEGTAAHVQVRVRVEGMLRDLIRLPKWLQEALVSRLKILAKLDISDRRRPQDGRIKVVSEDRTIELRVSTLPTQFGEKVVMRILGSGGGARELDSLGLSAADLSSLKAAVGQPQGMVLVTGPTGSGKTSTLYSVVQAKKDPTINIVTVEDPIEYEVEGVNQVQVNPKGGLTFAACLRSILRQDPDVILLGEIRDQETAEVALQAAMTGHLVLSTLHTNSTVATIGRLIDIGVDRPLISSAVNLILAQRLARKVCNHCKQVYRPATEALQKLGLQFSKHQFVRGGGCTECAGSGYSGRIAIYEVLTLTATMKDLINRGATESELHHAAVAGGLRLLLEDALDKVMQGTTTVEEVLRVIQLQDGDVTQHCPTCAAAIQPDFATCPHCTTPLRNECRQCRKELNREWKVCPYCNTSPERRATGAGIPNSSNQISVRRNASDSEATRDGHSAPCILVVDDDRVTRRMVVKALESTQQNATILEAGDGIQALAAIDSHQPDLVILDVMMPGMSGFDVCRQLRTQLQHAFTPVMMLTGNTDEESRTKGFLLGTDDYMTKPVSIPELQVRVKRLLHRTYGMVV